MYDIVIIGGGMAGLYSAYKLSKMYPKKTIKIVEKNEQLGGRVYTYKDHNFQVEAGAGRFTNKNKCFFELIGALGLKNRMIPISTDFKIVEAKCRPGIIQESHLQNYLKIILTNIKESKKTLQNMTFMDYARTKISPDEAKYLLDFFGYTSELTVMNAYDALEIMKTYFTKNTQYYILNGGLSQVVNKLIDIISKRNISISTRTEVTDIRFDKTNRIFGIVTKSEIIEAKMCICATTKDVLQRISLFEPIHRYLKYIELKPLCRIYAKYNTPWFESYKITTNNPLKYIIPIDKSQGIIMISYTDEANALFWKRIYDRGGIPELKRNIQAYIKQMFHIDTPQPRALKMFYWDKGVAYFTKGFDSTTMPQAIMHPDKSMPLFVCGENYSQNNTAWIEGALDTSNYVLKQIKEIKKIKI